MILRAAQHELRTGLANSGAVKQQTYMLWLGMLSAQHQTMLGCFKANRVASQAVVDALSHFTCHLLAMCHLALSFQSPVYASGFWSNFCLQTGEQKVKHLARVFAFPAASAGSTSIPQTGSILITTSFQ